MTDLPMPGAAIKAAAHRSALAWWATAAGILCQILYPLCTDTRPVTIGAVVFFYAAIMIAMYQHAGGRAVVLGLAAAAFGLAVEAIGVRTSVPFGHYVYTDSLGATIASVPVVVPLAWAGMALVVLTAARRCTNNPVGVTLLGAFLLTSWDVFLDPQMVHDGRWQWIDVGPTLPGVPGIPLSNFAGWLVVSAVLVAALDRFLPAGHGRRQGASIDRADPSGGENSGIAREERSERGADPGERGPVALASTILLWTYFSQVLGNLAFFHRPSVALAGGLAMGVVAIPYAIRLGRR